MNTVLWIGIVQCVFFIGLNATTKWKGREPLLALLWLILFAIHLGTILLIGVSDIGLKVAPLAKTLSLVHGPFLYLYSLMLLSKAKFNIKSSLHFLVFIIPLAVFYLVDLNGSTTAEYGLVTLKIVSLTAYVWLTFNLVNKRLNTLKNETANQDHLKINWVKKVGILFLASTGLNLLHLGFELINPGSFIQIIDILIYDLLIIFIGYYGIQNKVIYNPDQLPQREVYPTSPLQQEEMTELVSKVRTYLQESQAFKQPGFDLNTLSAELEIPKHHLSQVLNHGIGSNFYELINSLRIDEAIDMMTSGKSNHLSIEGLGYEVGFNSKSAFFTHFKKQTGQTPLQHQKKLQSGSD